MRSSDSTEEELGISTSQGRKRVAERLSEAGLTTERFIDVEDGKKQAYDHGLEDPEAVSGNYGVYTGEGLLALDIDDFSDESQIAQIDTLPETFTISTPHAGEHRYYRAQPGTVGAILAQSGGSRSPALDWGELYTSKYLVGPGSRIYGCGKSECCERDDPGIYAIEHDRPIAEVRPSEVARLFQDAPSESIDNDRQGSIVEFTENPGPATIAEPRTSETKRQEPPGYQTRLGRVGPQGTTEAELWTILRNLADEGPRQGAKVTTVLDRAEQVGFDRFQASEWLMAWVDSGKVHKGGPQNHIVPRARGSER